MLSDLFEGLVNEPDRAPETDYSVIPRNELKAMLFNQLMRQAMIDNPQPSILTLAIKIVGVDGADTSGELEELSTDELLGKIKRLL